MKAKASKGKKGEGKVKGEGKGTPIAAPAAAKKEAAPKTRKEGLSAFIRGLQAEGVDKDKGLQKVVDRLIASGQYNGDRDRAMKRAKIEWQWYVWEAAKKAAAAAPAPAPAKGKGKKAAAA